MRDVAQRRADLKRRLADKSILVAPGAGDALGARLIQRAGFEAVYISGFYVEGTHGFADVGLLSMSEIATRATQIVEAVDLPVFCDCDTGYGGIPNVVRTVREFERAGVAAIQLEDQALPKKCGSMAGKRLVTTEEMCGKIKAATDSRLDPNLMIIGRTDAAAIDGMDAAIDRICAYAEAGADLLMVLGPYKREDVARLVKALPKPFIHLNSESLTMPMIPTSELEAMGVRIAVFPLAMLLSATRAMERTLAHIRAKGTTLDVIDDTMVTWRQFNEIVGLAGVQALEERYTPVENAS